MVDYIENDSIVLVLMLMEYEIEMNRDLEDMMKHRCACLLKVFELEGFFFLLMKCFYR